MSIAQLENNGNDTEIKGNGNTVVQQINYNYTASQEQIRAVIDEYLPCFTDKITQELRNKKILSLTWAYVTNELDMDEEIKEIYKHCFRICAKEIDNNENYRTIKNLIDVINRLSLDDLAYIKLLLDGQQINYAESKFIKLKNLGIIESFIDINQTNNLISQELHNIQKQINPPTSFRPPMMMHYPLANYVTMSNSFTTSGKLLNCILKDGSTPDITPEKMKEITEILESK